MNLEVCYNESPNELDTDPSSVLIYTAVNPEQFYWCHWAQKEKHVFQYKKQKEDLG